jgi:2-polyprenyl-3-methyl-5-hydroxy-6-metoxy-1,4-benzoquinol methylase
LVDYAENLLTQAKKSLGTPKNIHFYKQNLYELKIKEKADVIISIRTLHHLEDVEQLINKLHENLNEGGYLILDIPNHYHVKNKIKRPFLIKKSKIKISEGYYNYNPEYIIEKIKNYGFNIVDKHQVGLFRIGFIKHIFPPSMLISIELILNIFLSSFNIGPSVYVVAKK